MDRGDLIEQFQNAISFSASFLSSTQSFLTLKPLVFTSWYAPFPQGEKRNTNRRPNRWSHRGCPLIRALGMREDPAIYISLVRTTSLRHSQLHGILGNWALLTGHGGKLNKMGLAVGKTWAGWASGCVHCTQWYRGQVNLENQSILGKE